MIGLLFLIFVRVNLEKNKSSLLATQQVKDYINQNSINIYVTSCLDAVTTDALIKASLQSGIINFSGKTLGKDYVRFNVSEYNLTANVSFVISPNDNCSIFYNSPLVHNSPPEYPYPETFLYPAYYLIEHYNWNPLTCKYSGIYYGHSGFFGYNSLLKLCDFEGANKIGATNTSYGKKTCESGTYSSLQTTSIQEEMEKYISDEMNKCVNFTEVLRLSAGNITQKGEPKTVITFGDDGFNVRIQYPFNVVVMGRQPILTFYDFSIDSNAKFKQIYDYSFYLIHSEVSEAGFNPLKDSQSNPDLARTYKGYEIKKFESIDSNHTDIFQIKDNSTQIDGKPLIFQFAVKNRRPALEYIHESSAILGVDIIVSENETVTITPLGYDPDSDILEYNYYLWKEDYDEYFNDTDPKCTGSTGLLLDLEYIKANCSIRVNSMPKNFTNSILFKTTKQNASYLTNHSDKGYHELKVLTKEKDSQGLEDWQIVKIFVFDKPVANITANNSYNDVPDEFASIEDRYVLNGSLSIIGLSGITGNKFSTFIWNDSLKEFNKDVAIISERNKSLIIPNDLNGTHDIFTIRPFVFSKIGKRNITLTVNTLYGLSDDVTFEIDVKQCLWHRNPANPPYPYNLRPLIIEDALFADHTCCNNTGGYNTSQTVCYTNISYGADSSFIDFWTRQPSPPKLPSTIIYKNSIGATIQVVGADLRNDIFNRTFTRYCDGSRGNICNGTASETRQIMYECDDTNGISGANAVYYRNERCQGPPSNSILLGTSKPALMTCVNYAPGNSFERILNPTQNDGICTTEKRCATGPGISGGEFKDYSNAPIVPYSPYSCSGQCGNGANSGKCNYPTNCLCSQSCGAEVLCNNLNFNDKVLSNNYQWCNQECQVETCPGNFAYIGNGVCQESCNDNSQCATGFVCDALGACVAGNIN
ncbi:MAG: hypothetical protein ACP5NV_02685 [Candidatus Woesearchaeota archaeon]